MQVIAVALEPIPQKEDVPEAIGVDDANLWSAALDDGVSCDRRAMDEEVNVLHELGLRNPILFRERLHPIDDRLLRGTRNAWGFENARPSAFVDNDKIRKGAAGVDTDSHAHTADLLCLPVVYRPLPTCSVQAFTKSNSSPSTGEDSVRRCPPTASALCKT